MRLFLFLSLFASLSFIVSCSSESEGDLKPDCSGSDLLIAELDIINAECSEPGRLTVSASGGQGGLSYSLGGQIFQMNPTFESLSPGNYMVVVQDENECTVSTSATVGVSNGGIALTVSATSTSGCGTSNGTLAISATGGDGAFTYRLAGGSFGSSSDFSDLSQGEYTIEAKDGAGCITSTKQYIASGISLTDQVMPIINTNCALSGCHGDTESPLLNSESAVRNDAARIRSVTTSGSMPPAGETSLTQNQIDLISCWVTDVSAGS